MRIPPYYRKPTWQQFFAGMVIGGIISWIIFLFIFGEWQEKYSKEIQTQKDQITDLINEKTIWQEEFKKINKESKAKLTVQSIYIKIKNKDKYHLDQLSVIEMEDKVREDIRMMIAKDIDTVYNSRELIKKIIENKTVKVNDKRYNLKVREMIIYTTLSIELEITIAD
ncbi:sporulation membrane protein YtrI [Niallia endozanthoxylica]|uniref:Sporulation protein n=1 Tax=Niallia endozanthoxylica TaxID=2036016 RepID=A0A5J5I6B3_9BACI|nr:sporulation membrane protein YtrI [Niallia endozanthoxylica]KAA9031698.1 sporulation protein [Niallia endozanthoxylica]